MKNVEIMFFWSPGDINYQLKNGFFEKKNLKIRDLENSQEIGLNNRNPGLKYLKK